MTNLLNIFLKELKIRIVRTHKKKIDYSFGYIFYIIIFDKIKTKI